jgi:uncharacterized membrane protein YbaN (DUF454 family)
MKRNIKRMAVLTIGIIFIIFGFFGLVLPFLQGFIFLAIGFILVSLCFPKVRFWLDEHTKNYPRLSKIVKKAEMWIMKITGEI